MRAKLAKELLDTDYVHRPLPIHYEETREYRCEQKPVLKSILLDELDNLDHWETVGPYAKMELARDQAREGGLCKASVKFTAPTRIAQWEGWPGRIYTIPSVMRKVDHENWAEINRISFWVKPDMPGFYNICLRMQFHNGESHPVPDKYDREGHHNINLLDGVWQKVSVEIPDIHRDDVLGLSFDYDMVGSEVCATDTACWYITDITLETLAEEELDNIEGWAVGKGRIAFSGSGYQPGSRKTAIVNEPGADAFKVVETATGRTVLEKAVEHVSTTTGEYQVLDFTEITAPGEYLIVCGSIVSRSFPIADDAFEDAIWKMLNYLYCQRCGFEVPGKHMACHRDILCEHDGKSIVVNGGWHDAGDMTQNLITTTECDYALFQLLDLVKDNAPLYKRVLEEAKWGLDYVLKVRFGDGWRCVSTSKSCWSDGIIGNSDDIPCESANRAIENFAAAALEAKAYRIFRDSDPVFANYCLKIAKEDWDFGYAERDNEGYDPTGDPARCSSQLLTYSVAAWSAVELWESCGDEKYRAQAAELAKTVLACQQDELTDWDIPFAGFFYDNTARKLIQHFSHRSHEAEPLLALSRLCQAFPEHEDWAKWYRAIELYSDYTKRVHEYTAPYYMAPASIYHEDEFRDEENDFGPLSFIDHNEQMIQEYGDQVRTGVPLGKGYHLRRMPVGFSFRGNNAVVLSIGHANALLGKIKNDYDHAELAQRQLEWIVGKNPFAQSVVYGEGYDYCQQYAVLPGEMVGEMSVGIENFENNDAPYWPQINTCVYKEVWTFVVMTWGWLLADTYGPAKVQARLYPDRGDITFENRSTGAVYSFTPCRESGLLNADLPAGEYTISYDGLTKRMALVAAKFYRLDAPLADYSVESSRDGGKVTVTVHTSGRGTANFAVKCENLDLGCTTKSVTLGESFTLTGTLADPKKPFVAVLIPDGKLDEKLEVFGK